METIQITSFEQLPLGINLLLQRIDQLEQRFNSHSNAPQTPSIPAGDQFRTRKETAAILKVTLATLNEYTKSGKIIASRIGSRVLYKDADIQSALNQVRTTSGKAA